MEEACIPNMKCWKISISYLIDQYTAPKLQKMEARRFLSFIKGIFALHSYNCVRPFRVIVLDTSRNQFLVYNLDVWLIINRFNPLTPRSD